MIQAKYLTESIKRVTKNLLTEINFLKVSQKIEKESFTNFNKDYLIRAVILKKNSI